MEKRIEALLDNGFVSSVYFTGKTDEMKERILSLDKDYVVVTDENTFSYSPSPERTVVLESGEDHKNWESLERILSFALDRGMGRDGIFIALGGGVVCDMTALASALYMRGAGLMLCPTTLLAMVDATLGGKAAIDFRNTKNTEIRKSTRLNSSHTLFRISYAVFCLDRKSVV